MNEDIKVNWVFSPSFLPFNFSQFAQLWRPPPARLSLLRPLDKAHSLSREREDENVWYSLPSDAPRVRCITISQSRSAPALHPLLQPYSLNPNHGMADPLLIMNSAPTNLT